MECRGVWRLWNGEPGFHAIGAGAAGGGFQLVGLSSCRRCAFRAAYGRSDTRPVPGARSNRVCDERNCDDHEYVHRRHCWNSSVAGGVNRPDGWIWVFADCLARTQTRPSETRARAVGRRDVGICGVALHLSSNHVTGEDTWWMELAGHHASLPLALLILYQDFRFALADIFLKRALAFILLAGLIFGMFVFGVTPLLAANPASQRSTAVLLALWVSTALAYPFLRRAAAFFVDKIIMTRVD